MDLGLKKWTKFVRYNREFVVTEFVITEFHCILTIPIFYFFLFLLEIIQKCILGNCKAVQHLLSKRGKQQIFFFFFLPFQNKNQEKTFSVLFLLLLQIPRAAWL
jgi:hypothetical protein